MQWRRSRRGCTAGETPLRGRAASIGPWRGKAVGPHHLVARHAGQHQLVVTMENLAGPHVRSHPDSPGSGAAPTLCPVAAQMTATKRISDALFPRGFKIASPRRSLQSTRTPSSCIRRSMYPRRKKFFSHIKRVFFQPQRNNRRRQQTSLQSTRMPSSCIRRSMYPRRRKFYFLVQQQQPKSGTHARS
jgi:hypothetical protein